MERPFSSEELNSLWQEVDEAESKSPIATTEVHLSGRNGSCYALGEFEPAALAGQHMNSVASSPSVREAAASERIEDAHRPDAVPTPSLRVFFVVSLILVSWFVSIALTRLIDGDEGYLLYAARLLAEGQNLYSDFFFPQGPLVPTIFGYFYEIFGSSWYGARSLAGVLAALTGLLVFATAHLYTRSYLTAGLATFLFSACGYSFGWLPIIKTYGLAAFFSMAAIYVLHRGGRYAFFWGGLLIVFSLEARLYVGIVGLNAILYVIQRTRQQATGKRLIWIVSARLGQLALGALVSLVFLLPPLFREFETAYFGMFEFASVRFPNQTGLFGDWGQKLDILLLELAIVGNDGAASAQLLILVFLAVSGWFLPGLPRSRLTSTVWPVLLLANLLPAVTFSQYVCICLPSIAIEAALTLTAWAEKMGAGPFIVLRTLAPALLIYLSLGVIDVRRFCVTGVRVPGVDGNPVPWEIETVEQVAERIDSYPEGLVAGFWPGYFVSSKTRVIPELANHFGFHISGRYDAARMKRLHLLSTQRMASTIRQRRYSLVVDGNWSFGRWDAQLLSKYRVDQSLANVKFWIPQPPAGEKKM